METSSYRDRLQFLRKEMGLSQKAFADFLNIPQPSISAYENGKNSPTIDVLISISKKCNVTLDWICGLTDTRIEKAYFAEITKFLYYILEINEIHAEIEINDHIPGDIETEDNRWYARITYYGNDNQHLQNSSMCNLIRTVYNDHEDLETYAIPKETYDLKKKQTIDRYSAILLTKKEYPELSREERMRRHHEYILSTIK